MAEITKKPRKKRETHQFKKVGKYISLPFNGMDKTLPLNVAGEPYDPARLTEKESQVVDVLLSVELAELIGGKTIRPNI